MLGYLAVWAAVVGLLVAMCVVDARTRRIPNKLVIGVCGSWAVLQVIAYGYGALAGAPLMEAARACDVPHALLPLFALPDATVGIITAAAAVLCLAGIGALYERLFRKQAMGAGDVKLIGAFALFLGPVPTIACVMLACIFALIAALPARAHTFPFAPALTLAFICVMLVGL